MGCVNNKVAKAKEQRVAKLRRRLSLGEIDAGPDVDGTVQEEDRSMLMQLSKQQVLELAKRDDSFSSRKYSVGSETDHGLHGVASFKTKTVKLQGDQFNAKSEMIGYVCKKGLKPESPNQDSFFIMKVEGMFSLYGVFDGHGRKGHDVSNFVKDNLPKILLSQQNLLSDTLKALETSFERTQHLIEKATNMKQIDAQRSGSTASVVFHNHKKGMLFIAHVGDSRVVLGKQHVGDNSAEQLWEGVDLTIDHKPDLPEERARIEKAGGMVLFDGGWNYRVYVKGKRDARGKRYPGQNMSRAMGDMAGFYDAGISAVPDVNRVDVGATHRGEQAVVPGLPGENGAGNEVDNVTTVQSGETGDRRSSCCSSSSKPSITSYSIDSASDRFVLLCSDGVWEFISSTEAVIAVSGFDKNEAMEASEALAGMAWKRWMEELGGQVVDDITALIVHLR